METVKRAVVFLCINNEQSKRKLRNNSIYNSIPPRYLGSNLPKEVKDLFIENYKTLMKESKEDLNKWENMPYS